MNDNSPRAETSPLATPDPWSLVAKGYSATTRQFLAEFSEAGLARLSYGPDSRVIDVACGPGTTAIPLAPEVNRIVCVDFSATMLEELRLAAEQAGVTNIDALEADGQALPFDDATFDIGISMFGLMFFLDRRKGFAELHRVLRTGGQALVSSWAPASKSPLMQTVMAALRDDNAPPAPVPAPSGLEVPENLEREMTQAGFADVEVFPVTRAVDVTTPEQFWRDTVRGTAPVAMLKRSMSDDDWANIEERAIARITAIIGPSPAALTSTAWLAVGRKP
jgi:SAM-dependent methyltransferase